MNLVLTVLEVVSPVFLLAAIGFVWVRLGFEYRMQFVTRLAMTLGVPCLIFVSLMQTEIRPSALTTLSVATLVAYGAVGLGALALLLARGSTCGRIWRRSSSATRETWAFRWPSSRSATTGSGMRWSSSP